MAPPVLCACSHAGRERLITLLGNAATPIPAAHGSAEQLDPGPGGYRVLVVEASSLALPAVERCVSRAATTATPLVLWMPINDAAAENAVRIARDWLCELVLWHSAFEKPMLRWSIRRAPTGTVIAHLLHAVAGRIGALPRATEGACISLLGGLMPEYSVHAFFAACAPYNRRSVERHLERFGLPSAQRLTNAVRVALDFEASAGLELSNRARDRVYDSSRTRASHYARYVGLPRHDSGRLAARDFAQRLLARAMN